MRSVYAMRELDREAAQGGPLLVDIAQCRRGSFALKRSTSSGKETAGNGQHSNGILEHAAREAFRLGYKVNSRSFRGETIEGSLPKGISEVYKVAIIIIAACFLAVTLMQGSMMFLVKHTDFLTIPQDGVYKSFEPLRSLLETHGLSGCERAVRIAVQNFTGHLPLRSSLRQASKLERKTRRPPRLALICPDLEDVPYTLYLITIARGLQLFGYSLELYAREDGFLRPVWEDTGFSVNFVGQNVSIDWLFFDGVIAVSLDAKRIVESLAQEPFVDIPLLWVILENVVLDKDVAWVASIELRTVYRSWFRTFNRSSVLVFPDYILPIAYNDFYNEKFFVIAGSPRDVWEAEQYMVTHTRQGVRAQAGIGSDDFVIVVMGSPCPAKDNWIEHAFVMRALVNVTSSSGIQQDRKLGHMKLFVLGFGKSTSGYQDALQMMSLHVGLEQGLVKHVGIDEDVQGLLWMADAVVYTSLWEPLSFPPIAIRAMSFERPIIVPDLGVINEHIVDGHSGFLFPAGDDRALGQALSMVRSNPILAHKVALEGASLARDMLARDAVVEYGYLLEKLLLFPEESQIPNSTTDIKDLIPRGWGWNLLSGYKNMLSMSTTKDLTYLKAATDLRFVGNNSDSEDLDSYSPADYDLLSEEDWNQEKQALVSETFEEVEDELVRDRVDKVRTSLEDVNKMVKKTETRVSQEKHHELDHLEVERVAQPLCIYEPYHGSGAWSFLHQDHLLYQGLSLSTEGRRPDHDDVDGARRLQLLSNSYYRDVLCDVGGIFAIAKLIDRVHRNSWIGFQPWRALSRKVTLQPPGEAALLAALAGHKDSNILFFWARMESTTSQPTDDFWDSCDSANAGNCRTIFLDTFKQMYRLPSTWMQIPPMPSQGGTWSAMHCWTMPTTSFLEFVMFARMFVDALDARQYQDHHDGGRCCFSRLGVEVKHCYCNFLEGLVNVWAYHSGRRMIYIDPGSGLMQEQHVLENRMGTLWVKWFRKGLLKSMDEDLAEEADDEKPNRRWLWPETGEVFWAGTKEKERRARYEAKVEKKRKQLERQAHRSKYKQRPIGRYVKPKPARQQSLGEPQIEC